MTKQKQGLKLTREQKRNLSHGVLLASDDTRSTPEDQAEPAAIEAAAPSTPKNDPIPTVQAAPAKPDEIALRQVVFTSRNPQDIADRVFRGRKARQINLKAILEQRFHIRFERIEGNNKPITALTFHGTAAQEKQLDTFFDRMIRNVNKNNGSIIEKQIKLLIDDIKNEGPVAQPQAARFNITARQKKHAQPERTIRLQHEVSKANNHGQHSDGLQTALKKIFVDKKGNNKTVADYIRGKLALTDLSVDHVEGQPITNVKITARSDEEIEWTKTLLNRLLADTRLLNSEGMEMRMREKRLEADIGAIRNGKPVHTVAHGDKILANQARKAAEQPRQQPANDSGPDESAFSFAGILPKNPRQKTQLEAFQKREDGHTADCGMFFGAAGTGKTFLSMVLMAQLLKAKKIDHIVITRPVLEAGNQRMGFLPGNQDEKVAPYMVPLAQALIKIFGEDMAEKMLEEKRKIKVVPLGFMRGMNIDRAGAILDEAQNCTFEEIDMFLTRMGPGSKVIVNGDPYQTDLKPKSLSGLKPWTEIMDGDPGTVIVNYLETDVVRSDFVKRVVAAKNRYLGLHPETQLAQSFSDTAPRNRGKTQDELQFERDLENPNSPLRRLVSKLVAQDLEARDVTAETAQKQEVKAPAAAPKAPAR